MVQENNAKAGVAGQEKEEWEIWFDLEWNNHLMSISDLGLRMMEENGKWLAKMWYRKGFTLPEFYKQAQYQKLRPQKTNERDDC